MGPDYYVFANRFGRRLAPSALRRRFERARDAVGLEPLRFHDLRHTYGSLLVAGGIDLASVKAAMGHSRITTTERYLHARAAGELADRFTRALGGASAPVAA
jgi:integrase